MQYKLTPAARNDLNDIEYYTVAHWGFPQAKNYMIALQQAIESLPVAPYSGRRCDHVRFGCHRLDVQSHAIFYTIAKNIKVLRILHQRMDIARHF
jgi:toxin ParE1/3/4